MNTSKKIKNLSLINTRDLTGIKTQDNLLIKEKRLIRSGKLSNASLKDLDILKNEYNLNLVIDLRNEVEKKQTPDLLPSGVNLIEKPILVSSHMGMTHEEKMSDKEALIDFVNRVLSQGDGISYMKNLYSYFVLDKHCLKMYSEFLQIVKDHQEGSLLFHCSVGKDRAGIAAAFILKLLNVSNSDIIEDYLLTNKYVLEDVNKKVGFLKTKINNPLLETCYFNLYLAKEEYITYLFDLIDKNYGSFNNFRKEALKFNDEDMEKLKANYLA